MRVSECVAAAYFGYLCAVALVRPSWPRRRQAAVASLAAVIAVCAVRLWPESNASAIARDWLPAVYLVLGYWLSGWYFVAPMTRIEDLFLRIDRQDRKSVV